MDNKMMEVAKLLGVELEEEFEIMGAPTTSIFKISEKGLVLYHRIEDWWEAMPNTLTHLLTGGSKIVKLSWKPAMNDTYYYPTPSDKELWERTIWVDSGYDSIKLSRGLVFKTSKEAAEVAKKMLAVAKEVRNNG